MSSEFESESKTKSKSKMKKLVNTMCEFLDSIEENYPIPTHPRLFDSWQDDVRNFLEESLGEELSVKETQVFNALLHMRRDAHLASRLQVQTSEKDTSWHWLLTAQQVAQRTTDWHLEKMDLLTASEIAGIWSTPRQRGRLVMSKVPNEDDKGYTTRLAIRRKEGNAMDWGVRYEPVVKQILEKQLGITITDLGRIRHQSVKGLAASPDGLITEGPDELVGRLVEIKCPPSRPIDESKVPFEYWCQMQIQMEVCDRPACEYVEVKFKEFELADPSSPVLDGYITLEEHSETFELRYQYHLSPLTPAPEDGWNSVETYGYKVEKLRRITEIRDTAWFESVQKDITAFWNDVAAARLGEWVIPPSSRASRKKKEPECLIVNEEPESENS